MATKSFNQLFAVAQTIGFEQQGARHAFFVVDIDGEQVTFQVKFEPEPTLGDDFGAVVFGTTVHGLRLEVDASTAAQLVDHDALCAVDDKGATRRHHRKIAQEDVFFCDGLSFAVHQTNGHTHRATPGAVALFCLFAGCGRFFNVILHKLEAKGAIVTLDGEKLGQQLLQTHFIAFVFRHTILKEGSIRHTLHVHHVRHGDKFAAATKGETLASATHWDKLGHVTHSFNEKKRGLPMCSTALADSRRS